MLIWEEANERDPPNPLKKKKKREIFSQLFSDCIYIYIYEERERERERERESVLLTCVPITLLHFSVISIDFDLSIQ